MGPGEVPPLPGEYWRHPTESDLFLMQDIGGPMAPPKATKPGTAQTAAGFAPAAPLFRGDYGFVPPSQPTVSADR